MNNQARIIEAKLLERIKRTPTIESFRFQSSKKIDFIPGQFLQLIFNEENLLDREFNKYLSFSSSPNKNYFEFTKRLSNSKFSQKLRKLKKDDDIKIKAPFGNCIFKDDYEKIGFLIGGIGITPVISIIEYIIDNDIPTDVALFYSNRSEEEIAFRKELDQWNKKENINIFYSVTECEPNDKTCMKGYINKDMVREKNICIEDRIFYIFGPPAMVKNMKSVCGDIGCYGTNVRTESFTGY
jgi:NAD(P)H-flavin reductase